MGLHARAVGLVRRMVSDCVFVQWVQRARVRASFWQGAAGAWGCRVLVEWWRWKPEDCLWERLGKAEGGWGPPCAAACRGWEPCAREIM